MLKRRNEAISTLGAYVQSNNIPVTGIKPALVEKSHIITGKLSGTTLKFLDVNSKNQIGLQTFSENKLPANKHFVVSAMKLEFAEGTKGSNSIATASFSKTVPAIVKNGSFKMTQEGRSNLVDVLNDVLVSENAHVTNADRFYDLELMEVLQAEKVIEAEMTLPASLPDDKDYYVKITFKGYEPR